MEILLLLFAIIWPVVALIGTFALIGIVIVLVINVIMEFFKATDL